MWDRSNSFDLVQTWATDDHVVRGGCIRHIEFDSVGDLVRESSESDREIKCSKDWDNAVPESI